MHRWILLFAAAVIGLIASTTLAQAPTTQAAAEPSTRPAAGIQVADLCKIFVDSYDSIELRNRFINAAGVDNELDEKEFLEDQARAKGFVQSYDRWSEMLKFDKNNNKMIDWAEGEAYRQSVRDKVLSMYDTNKDGKLTGLERESANLALAAGDIFDGPRRGEGMLAGGPRGGPMGKMAGGSGGGMSDEEKAEAVKAYQERERQRILAKYDKNVDGKLDDEERKAMQEDMRRQSRPWQAMFEDWAIKQFDEDGDGVLNEQEKAAAQEFQKKFRELGQILDFAMNDLDGDGKVTPEERQQVQNEWRKQAFNLIGLTMRYMDTDGDGKVSEEERSAFNDRMQRGVAHWLEETTAKYDTEHKGRLNAEERDAMLQGLREDLQQRIKYYGEANGGRFGPAQMVQMMTDFGKEIGIEPVQHATSEPSEK